MVRVDLVHGKFSNSNDEIKTLGEVLTSYIQWKKAAKHNPFEGFTLSVSTLRRFYALRLYLRNGRVHARRCLHLLRVHAR